MEASIQSFVFPVTRREALMLRLDRINAWATGNKYFKLKYTLQEAMQLGYSTIVSKGGMFSNHLAALADACQHFNLKLIALVRSYGPDQSNPSIQHLIASGVTIHYLTPEVYRAFDPDAAKGQFADAYFIPEGGLSIAGIKGTSEIIQTMEQARPTHLVLAGGTMGTAIGILSAAPANVKVVIVPAWKGCTSDYIEDLIARFEVSVVCTWEVWPDFHFGGFGRFDAALIEHMSAFSKATGIPLDPVYTGKVIFAIDQKVKEDYFTPTDKVMMIHTGGLQGLRGYKYRFPDQWAEYADRYTQELR